VSTTQWTKEDDMPIFSVPLTDITVRKWFPPILPLEEILIEGGTGVLTVYDELPGPSHFYLEVTDGKRPNRLALGEVVVASGKDSAGITIAPSGRMETVDKGKPAVFRGPYPP
jgi:hypothetical protein